MVAVFSLNNHVYFIVTPYSKMRKLLVASVIIIFVVAIIYVWNNYKGIYFANKPSTQNIVDLAPLKIPSGFTFSIFASGLNDPRGLALDPNGTLVVSLTGAGKVVAIVGGQAKEVIAGLDQPHGIVFHGKLLYIAETDKVSIFDYDPKNYKASGQRKIIDLPGGGEHFTRSLLINKDKLYVSIGSDCNACIESDTRRASIWQANLDGTDFRPYSTGLRNAVFMATNPQTNEIWATNMGRDFLGDNLPPDTVNIIKNGANYGWPYCYGNKVVDNEINPGGSKFDCTKMEPPQIEIPAHSAPLGLAFMGKALLIAYHGSWNRTVPTGYKIVEYVNGKLQDFITGWLKPNGDVLGRPVDILVKTANEIYISDDKAGIIYLLKSI